MDSFVYCWVDALTGMLYVGVHKGQAGDGYVCSSKLMKEEYKKRPHDFSRKILSVGAFKEMHKFETWFLGCVDAANNPLYYNKTNNYGPFYNTGPQTEKTKAKMSRAARLRCEDPLEREKMRTMASRRVVSVESREKLGKSTKKRYGDPLEREKTSNAGKKRFKDPSEREKMSEGMRNARATKFWSTKKKPNLGVN